MKISLNDIINEHLNTFRKSDGRFLVVDLMIFLVIPIVITLVLQGFFVKGIPQVFVESLLTWFLTTNWKFILDIFIYFLFIELLLHLFLILNRFNILINEYIVLRNRHKNN